MSSSSNFFINPPSNTSELLIEVTKNRYAIKGVTGFDGYGYESNILFEDSIIPLSSLTHLSRLKMSNYRNISNIKLVLSCLDENKSIILPENISKNLLHFLCNIRREEANCKDFINDLYFGCGSEPLNHISITSDYIPLEEAKLEIGDAIILTRTSDPMGFCHIVMNLGNDLCISDVDSNSPIVITTIDQMKLLYNANALKVNLHRYEELTNVTTYVTPKPNVK